jgi:hypothetical protein
LSGLSAGDQPSRLLRIYAALAGAVVAYPWLLAGFYSSGRDVAFICEPPAWQRATDAGEGL